MVESGTVEGGRTAGCSSLGDEKEGPRGRTSRHTDEHGKPRVDVQEPGTVEGGRAAGCSSLGDEKEGPPGGTSRHTNRHEQPCPHTKIHGRSGKVRIFTLIFNDLTHQWEFSPEKSFLCDVIIILSPLHIIHKWHKLEPNLTTSALLNPQPMDYSWICVDFIVVLCSLYPRIHCERYMSASQDVLNEGCYHDHMVWEVTIDRNTDEPKCQVIK